MQARIIAVIVLLAIISGAFFYIQAKDNKIQELTEQNAKLDSALKTANETIENDKKSDKITDNSIVNSDRAIEIITVVEDKRLTDSHRKISSIESKGYKIDNSVSPIDVQNYKNAIDDETSVVMITALWESYCSDQPNKCENKGIT